MVAKPSERQMKAGVATGWLLLAVISVTLAFGLWPGDYRFVNEVRLSRSAPGLMFGKYSLGITEPFDPVLSPRTGFTIEVAVRPLEEAVPGFRTMVQFRGEGGGSQLLLAGYGSWFIAMNGQDYQNRRREPRLACSRVLKPGKEVHFIMVNGPDGSKLFVDGQAFRCKSGPSLDMPPAPMRLLIGSEYSGKHQFRGEILGLGLLSGHISESEALEHYRSWRQVRSFAYLKDEGPRILYTFEDVKGLGRDPRARGLPAVVPDEGTVGADLHLPKAPLFPERAERAVLMPGPGLEAVVACIVSSRSRPAPRGLCRDVLINLFGFIPLGISALVFFRFMMGSNKRAVLFALCLSALVSLVIEVVQGMWLPSRSSDLLDLICNCLGAGLGAVLGVMVSSRLIPHGSRAGVT